MFIQSLLKFFSGYIVVCARGQGAEKLFNLAVARGIPLWDLKYLKDSAVSFKTYPDNFFRLRPLTRKVHCTLHIERKVGIPFLFSNFFRRKGLVIGLLLFILTLYTVSNFIWFIEIKGIETIQEEEILQTAEELGITIGILKRNLDFSYLEKDFLLKQQELNWVGFKIQGTKLIIEVVEKISPLEEIKDITSDLIAIADGLVEKVLVLSGEAKVEPGDTVQKGQVLISGIITDIIEGEEEGQSQEIELNRVRARGEVWTRVWYEFFSTVPLVKTHKERTGEKSSAFILRFSDEEVQLGKDTSPYRNYEREVTKRKIKWRNIDSPIELITIAYYELILIQEEISRDEALYTAKEEVFLLAEENIPTETETLTTKVEEIQVSRNKEIKLRLIVETLENIVEEKEHYQSTDKKEDQSD